MATGTITKVVNDSNTGYCKMPDGTLICWGEADPVGSTTSWGSLYAIDATVNITFPVAFSTLPFVSFMCDANASFIFLNSLYDLTHITRVSWVRQTTATNNTVHTRWFAIGRWK